MRLPAFMIALFVLLFASLVSAQPVDDLEIGEDTEEVAGHRVVLNSHNVLLGRAEDSGSAGAFLVLRTSKGTVSVPRSEIARVESAQVPAAAVLAPGERYEKRRAQIHPGSPDEHLLFSQWCLQIGAYAQAGEHAEIATKLLGGKDDAPAKSLLGRANLLKLALGAIEAKKDVRRLVVEEEFEAARVKLKEIRAAFAKRPKLLQFLRLNNLAGEILEKARSAKYAPLKERFQAVLDRCVMRKLEEMGLTLKEALRWAAAGDGLTKAFFAELARELGMTEEEARLLWKRRPWDWVFKYAYGPGVFLRPALKGRRDALAGKVDLTTPGVWWASADTAARRSLLRAWFAENSAVHNVLRIETRICRWCGCKGFMLTTNAATAEEIRRECLGCMGVGQDWIVICW